MSGLSGWIVGGAGLAVAVVTGVHLTGTRTGFESPPVQLPAAVSEVAVAGGALPGPDHGRLAPAFHARLEEARRRARAHPDDDEAGLALARLLHDAHQLEEAAGQYRAYLEHHPDVRDVWFDLTDCLGQLGRWREAQAAMKAWRAKAPDDREARYNLGVIAANLGDVAGARTWWSSLTAGGSDSLAVLARSNLARLDAVGRER